MKLDAREKGPSGYNRV